MRPKLCCPCFRSIAINELLGPEDVLESCQLNFAESTIWMQRAVTLKKFAASIIARHVAQITCARESDVPKSTHIIRTTPPAMDSSWNSTAFSPGAMSLCCPQLTGGRERIKPQPRR
jgi:hypothetical protein